jgi:hypothetical protein
MSPVSGNLTRRESWSVASIATVRLANSTTPITSEVKLGDRGLLGGKVGGDLAQEDEPDGSRELDQDPELRLHQGRGAAAVGEDRHRAEDVTAGGRRKEGLEVADDLGGVGDRVLGEEDVVDGVGADPGLERLGDHGALDPRQPADPVQVNPSPS